MDHLPVKDAGGGIERRRLVVKSALDRSVAAVLLLLAAVWLLVIAVAIRLDSPGPILARERRLGRDGREFWLLTFRSSVLGIPPGEPGQDRAAAGFARIRVATRVGRILRRCCLDELPKLVNVLAGDMSLVGPRPQEPEVAEDGGALPEPLPVRPGLTGLLGRSARSGSRRAEPMDLDEYVQNYSIGLDLSILGRAVRAGMTGGRPG
jgi:lipopolysaccharide/colanic/teichoic acid biosynthesis glycosyltransferase